MAVRARDAGVAATQAAAGLTPDLFEGLAQVYADLAGTALAAAQPEAIDRNAELADVLRALRDRTVGPTD